MKHLVLARTGQLYPVQLAIKYLLGKLLFGLTRVNKWPVRYCLSNDSYAPPVEHNATQIVCPYLTSRREVLSYESCHY